MYMQQAANLRFNGSVAPPEPSSITFYMKCNSASYYLEEIGANTPDYNSGYNTSAASGAFNGYIYGAGGSALLRFVTTKADNAMFNYAAGFTMELFYKRTSATIYRAILNAQGEDTKFVAGYVRDNAGQIEIFLYARNTTSTYKTSTGKKDATGGWQHCFIGYDGTKLYMGCDGTILHSETVASSVFPNLHDYIESASRKVELTIDNPGDTGLDNLVIHSTCKWSGNVSDAYTPPSAEY